jgi:integrase
MRHQIFSSSFAPEIRDFLVFKRARGHDYGRAEHTLLQFDRLVKRLQKTGPVRLKAAVSAWLSERTAPKPVSVATEFGVIRGFCLYLRRYDERSFIPSRDWVPQSAESVFTPYVLSKNEIAHVLGLAASLQPQFRKTCTRTLILLLYCTGLRFGEAVRLRIGDVDVRERTVFVRESKGRSRYVPFDATLCRKLQQYLRARRSIAQTNPDNAFFTRADGSPLLVKVASSTLRDLFRRAGLKPAKGRTGPRPYDLRHTFAVHRLTRWYRQGVDLHTHLPLLSVYMGHDNILGTEAYLQATPELLELAAERFRRRMMRVGGADGTQA